MSKALEELKAELNRAIADRQRITSRASSIPALKERAAEKIHLARRAAARGDGGKVQIKESRAALHALRDEEETIGYEVDVARERVLEAEIAAAELEMREAMEESSAWFERVLEARSEREHFERLEAERMGRSSSAEGRANRAQRRGKDALDALEKFRQGRQTRREQTLVNEGIAPRARQRRASEVVID